MLGPNLDPQGAKLVLPLPSPLALGTGITSPRQLRGQSLVPTPQEPRQPRGTSPGQVPDTE